MLKSYDNQHSPLKWWALRFIGVVFVIVGLYYVVYSMLGSWFPFQPTYVHSVPPRLVTNPSLALIDIAWRGIPLSCLAIGLVCIAISFRKAGFTYWCTQIALWLIGISLWYHFNSFLSPLPHNPAWIIVTACCSLVLFLFRKRIVAALSS